MGGLKTTAMTLFARGCVSDGVVTEETQSL